MFQWFFFFFQLFCFCAHKNCVRFSIENILTLQVFLSHFIVVPALCYFISFLMIIAFCVRLASIPLLLSTLCICIFWLRRKLNNRNRHLLKSRGFIFSSVRREHKCAPTRMLLIVKVKWTLIRHHRVIKSNLLLPLLYRHYGVCTMSLWKLPENATQGRNALLKCVYIFIII